MPITQAALDALKPTLFRVEADVTYETQVLVLVTPEAVAEYVRHGGRQLAAKWDMDRFMEWVAEQIAEEAADEPSRWQEAYGGPHFRASAERIPDDPEGLLKGETVWKSDGTEATAEDLQGGRFDRYGRPLPPPPIPGQEQLAV